MRHDSIMCYFRLSSPCRQKAEWWVLGWGGGLSGMLLFNGDRNPMYNEQKVIEMIMTVGKHCEYNFLPQNCSFRSGYTVKHWASFITLRTKLCGANHLCGGQVRTGFCSIVQAVALSRGEMCSSVGDR